MKTLKRALGPMRIIVTGDKMTGSKHFSSLEKALAYIKKLIESGQGMSISIVGDV